MYQSHPNFRRSAQFSIRGGGSYRKFGPRFGGRRGPAAPNIDIIRIIEGNRDMQQRLVASEEVAFTPTHRFSDFALVPELQANIVAKGYELPTPVQDQAIPLALNGQDVIGVASTGTGKTAAFLLPLINKVLKNRAEKVLIITPTRELATQIFDEFRSFTKGLNLTAAVCIGGLSMGRQRMDLRRNPNFVIGTPGRLKDLAQEKQLYLGQFRNVVLDEADRMVDIGFINEIKYFLSFLPKERQSLFFSATISGKVADILRDFVHSAVTVTVKQSVGSQTITQDVIRLTPGKTKIDTLHDLLASDGFDRVLIFGRTKWAVQKLSEDLVKRGFRAGAIHGNKNQNQRQRILNDFKSGQIKILLATDVASRGIDIPSVSHVINYELPATYEDYVHRIGRTGRADKKGIALTFAN